MANLRVRQEWIGTAKDLFACLLGQAQWRASIVLAHGRKSKQKFTCAWSVRDRGAGCEGVCSPRPLAGETDAAPRCRLAPWNRLACAARLFLRHSRLRALLSGINDEEQQEGVVQTGETRLATLRRLNCVIPRAVAESMRRWIRMRCVDCSDCASLRAE